MLQKTLKKIWFAPVISTFVRQRTETLIIGAVGLAQVGLVYAHLPGWPCPFKAVFGIPCPGCGLSTACSQLLHGQFQLSFQTHAFALPFLIGITLVLAACLLPERMRQPLINRLTWFEEHSGFTAWFLLALFIYWSLRLIHIL